MRRLLRAEAERLRRQPLLFREFVERLKRRRPRSAILLFGSRARGEARPASDYDVAIVLPDPDPLEEAIRARRERPRGLSVDVVVLGVRQLEDPVYARMLEGAVVLHDGLNLFGGRRVRAGSGPPAAREKGRSSEFNSN